MGRYDIYTTCPICGQSVHWTNGLTNYGLVLIKTKRKSVLVIHENCIEKENKANEHNKG